MSGEKIAVVTGANKGIGFETARLLAGEGIEVILTARDEARGKKACGKLKKEGADVHFHRLEVTDQASIDDLYEYVRKEFGRVDILINNAGIKMDTDKSGMEMDLDTMRNTMEINVNAPLALCQKFIPLMKKNGYGRIVNVSSQMGQLSGMSRGSMAYRTSKTALNAITRLLALELNDSNILINAGSPGWTRTDMGGPNAPRSTEEGADTIVWLATLPDGGPTGGFFQDRKPLDW